MAATQRVALVTGAGTGIGKASAYALLQDGWSVAFAGRRKEVLDQAIAESNAPAARTLAVQANVGEPASVKALFAAVKAKFGRLDLLFNNAGTGAPPVPLEELTVEQWKTVVDANLNGVFYCTQEAFRMMKAQDPRGGRIINNGSISAHTPRPNSSPYTSTKHAVTGLTKASNLDGRAHGISVGQIDIGNAATPMTARMAKGVLQPDGSTRVEPTMDVQNVARAIVYMANATPEANVPFLTVMATQMPWMGRG
jgi:NAD(P)-dependent dehydrogenase (short-subunit alcohol dehydrogenase family)